MENKSGVCKYKYHCLRGKGKLFHKRVLCIVCIIDPNLFIWSHIFLLSIICVHGGTCEFVWSRSSCSFTSRNFSRVWSSARWYHCFCWYENYLNKQQLCFLRQRTECGVIYWFSYHFIYKPGSINCLQMAWVSVQPHIALALAAALCRNSHFNGCQLDMSGTIWDRFALL